MQIPDFVVLGGQYEIDGENVVILIASKNLSEVKIDEILRNLNDLRYSPYTVPSRYDIYFTTKVKDYVMIQAKTYPEAWQSLFKFWSPTPSNKDQDILEERAKLANRKEILFKND